MSEIEKKYQELLETLSPEQEEVITEYCNAIFSSGADTEEFFCRLRIKNGLNLKSTVKSTLEICSKITWRSLKEKQNPLSDDTGICCGDYWHKPPVRFKMGKRNKRSKYVQSDCVGKALWNISGRTS